MASEGGLSEFEIRMLEKHMEQNWSGLLDTRPRRERVLALYQYLQSKLGAQREEAWGILNRGSLGKNLASGSPLATIRASVEYMMDEVGWSAKQTLQVFHRQPQLFRTSVGVIAKNLTVLENHLGRGRKELGPWLVTRPAMLVASDLDAKFEFYLNTVGVTVEALMKWSTFTFSSSLNDRLRPRYDFVTQLEERSGLRAGASPLQYMIYSTQQFERFLAREFGPDAVAEFAEFRHQYDVKHRPQMRDIDMNDYEREMIEGYCRKHHRLGMDTIKRCLRLLNLGRYLQDELGAGEEEAWGLVLKPRTAEQIVYGTPLDTIRGSVDYLKIKEGWSAAQILRAFKRDTMIFRSRAGHLANRVRVIKDKLELTPEEAASWLEERPYALSGADLEERLAYYMERVGLSKEDLMIGNALLYSSSLEARVKPRFEFVRKMEERRGRRVKTLPQTYLVCNRVRFEQFIRREFGEDAVLEYEEYHADRIKGLRGRG